VDRDHALQERIVEGANIQGLTLEDYRNALDEQTNTTVGILANGKPIMEVDFRVEEPKIVFIGMAETPLAKAA